MGIGVLGTGTMGRNHIRIYSSIKKVKSFWVHKTGYRRLIPEYAQDGLFMAGMFSRPNYPERSMEGSIVAGEEVAAAARSAARHG